MRAAWLLLLALALGVALGQEVDPREEAKKQKELLLKTAGILPTELVVAQGEELFNRKGPSGRTMAECDFGLGKGVLEGAAARLPRYLLDTAKVEDVVLTVEAELTSNGLNRLPNVKVGPVTVIMPCKSEWARVMFLTQPAGGFAAPCRFFAMQMGPDVLVGAIEPMLMTIMLEVMGTPAVPMLQEARQVMGAVLEAVGGVPYRPGQ
jgi:hypothetical protein